MPVRRADGFTLMELLLVVAVVGVLSALAIGISPRIIEMARAEGAASPVVAALRTAREQAISQRRDIHVVFVAPNVLQVFREEFPGGALTQLTEVTLENGLEFVQFAGQGDTPDAFGAAAAVDFGVATALQFTSEGSFLDQNDDVLNGTVFLGRPNMPHTARAVTIFGPTALIREWRWDGRQWME
jgi:prepilin-type N-terminal cleavage/methylation domain-containing protein